MRVILGDNIVDNCDAALIINGVEVFRLREGMADGQLLVDFELRDENDELVAKVAKNKVVYARDGYEVRHVPGESIVVGPDSSDPVARVTRESTSSVRVCGNFWVDSFNVVIQENGGILAGTNTISGNKVSGCGTAITLEPNSIMIGSAPPKK